MEDAIQPIKQGDAAASGAAAITVEKHKNNFMTQYGTFEDKPAQNITRWLAKADKYKDSHMIPSLEMASIVIHCVRGEPAIKVRRMLDVPGDNYLHADHYCEQLLQDAVEYQPYRERVPARELREEQAGPPPVARIEARDEIEARPAITPRRFQPRVHPERCLKHYLLQLYGKRVNLSEADKFLNTFKIQKPKQTCSNYLDEFVINYENYAHLKWTTAQLDGVQAVQEVLENLQAEPPVAAVRPVAQIPGNQPLRDAEMLQLVTDGICKEFKIHCDNIQYNLNTTNFADLEVQVMNWQRSTTTGKQFTTACTPAKPGTRHAHVSALEIDEYQDLDKDEWALLDAQTSSTSISPNSNRGMRGGRGNRGAGRGTRGRGGRGRGATASSNGIPRPNQIISRDTQDGNHPNYRQTPDGQLHRSPLGHPLCNYCGIPSHKRERCTVKAADREKGLTRLYHPDRDKPISNNEKAKTASAAIPRQAAPAVSMMAAPAFNYQPWPFPVHYNPLQAPAQGANMQWQQQQLNGVPPRMEYEHKSSATQLSPMTSAVPDTSIHDCPYPTCQAVLPDLNQAQEHLRAFHSLPTTLAAGPGINP